MCTALCTFSSQFVSSRTSAGLGNRRFCKVATSDKACIEVNHYYLMIIIKHVTLVLAFVKHMDAFNMKIDVCPCLGYRMPSCSLPEAPGDLPEHLEPPRALPKPSSSLQETIISLTKTIPMPIPVQIKLPLPKPLHQICMNIHV